MCRINDDVNMTSIPYWDQARVDTVPEGTRQCIFWGLGSDGTVGANRSAVKIIGDNSDLMVQAYFAFDAFKSGGVTSSHLRFGPQPITAQYLITNADYIACHFQEYVRRFTLLDQIKDGGTFVLNTRWSADELEKYLPARIRRQLAEKKVCVCVGRERATAINNAVRLLLCREPHGLWDRARQCHTVPFF